MKHPQQIFFDQNLDQSLDIDSKQIWGRFGAPPWGRVRLFGRQSWAKLSQDLSLKLIFGKNANVRHGFQGEKVVNVHNMLHVPIPESFFGLKIGSGELQDGLGGQLFRY